MSAKTAEVFIGLGSNIGDRQKNIKRALKVLSKKAKIVKRSSLYKTEPIGLTKQNWFFNCAVKVRTNLLPQELMAFLLEIEQKLGRKRRRKFGPRTIDLDILFYGNKVVKEKNLKIPHPKLYQRRFVLKPLAEIEPELKDPKTGKTIWQLLGNLPSRKVVENLRPKILAICGSPRANGNTEIAIKEAIKAAKKAGADVELVLLRKRKWKSCCGASECFYTNVCIVHDEFAELNKKMIAADAWLLASPNYFNNVSGLMKDFFDRTNPYTRPPLYKGKKVGLIAVGGWSHKSNKKAEAVMREFALIHKLKVVGNVICMADDKGDILQDKKGLKACSRLGQILAKASRAN